MSIRNIPQTYRNIDFGKVQYAKRTEEDQVFYDLMARVINVAEPKTTFKPYETLKENDPDFVRKVLVPPFLKLRQKLPQVYSKMFMSKNFFNFHIKIIEHKDKQFKYEGIERRMSAASRINGNDGAIIYLNKFDNFNDGMYKETIFHEIMHILVGLAVKAQPDFKASFICVAASFLIRVTMFLNPNFLSFLRTMDINSFIMPPR